MTAAVACALAGCATRYDQAGVSRVGVFLWGFGDPPGVNWNLNWPRREVPELPAAPRRELSPRESARAPGSLDEFEPNGSTPERLGSPIDDNLDRVSRCAPESTIVTMACRADARDDDTVRR